MEINFFGLMDVTRKAMETMRDLKTGGVIQQVTSMGGQVGESASSHRTTRMTNAT
jgi:short-subunit dehydrogenase